MARAKAWSQGRMCSMEECGKMVPVKEFRDLGTGMAERSVKCLFYGTRNLTLEELSEMVTSNLNKKEM